MKTFILASAILLALFSCNKEKSEIICSHSSFVFVNQLGEDIFNNVTPSHLEILDFNIFTPDSTVILNYYNYIVNDTNIFDIGINGLSGEGITYLRFGTITVDTIFAKYEESENSLYIKELYYNGNLIEQNDGVTVCGRCTHKIIIKEE